ncbi:MAG: hypothetical protein M3044_07780 [Thermoproteota archaeon]|nr:hypothetical protein [Thermoproteota archaeon]
MNFPSQYLIEFFLQDNFKKQARVFHVADYSGWIPIPLSQFSISPIPGSISSRPGETQTISLQVSSSTAHDHQVTLEAVKMNGINATFIPALLDVPPYQTVFSLLQVNPAPNATAHVYRLQIFAHIFPTIEYLSPSISNEKKGTNILASVNLPNTFQSMLHVTVLKPLSLEENLRTDWVTYGNGISLVGAGFAGGLSTYVFNYLKSRGKQAQEK